METYRHNHLTVELHNEEVDTLGEVLRLAHEHLCSASLFRFSGCPLERQAGLFGTELFLVKTMIEKLGKVVGIDLPYDAATGNDPELIPLLASGKGLES